MQRARVLYGQVMAVTDDAIAAIRSMIMSGELKPGDRLPPEAQLSERLGLSRNSLREAVKALALIRVLDVRQGDGTFVTSLEPSTLVDSLSFIIELHRDASILDLLGVRRILEGEATFMAASQLDADHLDRLLEVVDSVDAHSPVQELVAADIEFHRMINSSCGNAYLSATLEGISSATHRARVWRGVTEENALERTLNEHRAIVDAMRAGRPDLARAYAIAHVSGVEMWVSRQLADPPSKQAN